MLTSVPFGTCTKTRLPAAYRVLEPVLGILEYDAELRLTPISDTKTAYTAARKATLEPGAVESLGGLLSLETQNMKNHFAKQP